MAQYLSRYIVCSWCDSRKATHTVYDAEGQPALYLCEVCATEYLGCSEQVITPEEQDGKE